MKDELKIILKEKTTWLGIAAIVVAAFGLETLSAEQLATVLAGAAAIWFPETKK